MAAAAMVAVKGAATGMAAARVAGVRAAARAVALTARADTGTRTTQSW